jgi:hypothetical protein
MVEWAFQMRVRRVQDDGAGIVGVVAFGYGARLIRNAPFLARTTGDFKARSNRGASAAVLAMTNTKVVT